MFGYVKACKGELKVKEYELYSSAYCGLCRSMKKTTGQLSRLTLSYDFVFLYLIRCALEGEVPTLSFHRCPIHPIKKRPMVDYSESLFYASRASAELCACKAEDDIADSKGTKRLAYRAIYPFFSLFRKKADLPKLQDAVKEKLSLLSKLESESCASLDMVAEAFGKVLGEVFSYGLNESKKTVAYEIGFHTGKFIYVADAADDYCSDIKSNSYNPIIEIYKSEFGNEQKKSIETALLYELRYLESAINLVDFSLCPDFEKIVYNIIYLGMPEQMHKALYKEKERKSNKIRKG